MKTKLPRSATESSSKAKWGLPLFLGGIMILSTFAIIFSGQPETSTLSYKYKDIYFQSTPQGWQGTVQGQPLTLRYGPKELESLYPDLQFSPASSLLGVQKVYMSSLPDEPVQEALREFYVNSNALPPLALSCIDDVPGCEQLPLKTCKDATASTGVLIFRLGAEEQIMTEGTCVTLVSNTTLALTQMTDKLIYSLYGVY